MDIMTGISALSQALDITKKLKVFDEQLNDAEYKLQISNLYSSLADAQIALADAKSALTDKDKIIRELQEAQDLQLKMEWKDPVYCQKNEKGEEDYFCQQCFDSTKKAIRLQIYDKDHWHCSTCNNDFFGKTYSPPAPIVATDYDPYESF